MLRLDLWDVQIDISLPRNCLEICEVNNIILTTEPHAADRFFFVRRVLWQALEMIIGQPLREQH